MERKPSKLTTSSSRPVALATAKSKPPSHSLNKSVSLRSALSTSASSHSLGLHPALPSHSRTNTTTSKPFAALIRPNLTVDQHPSSLHSQSFLNTSACARRVSRMSLGSTAKPSTRLARHSELPAVVEKRPLPLPSSEALSHYREELTAYEISEILSFETVFYLGKEANKAQNSTFDNEKGDYVPILGDHMAYRYEIKGILGKGSFGIVLRCLDHKHKEEVALKVIKNKKLFHQQGLVEVRVLQMLREKDKEGLVPVVCLRSHFQFRHHLCLVFELLSISLYDYIKNTHFQPLDMLLIRKVAIQLLKVLIFIKKLRIIHCDLKPENILLRAEGKSTLKVIDFGSSCFENAKVYSYIQSRFYRAPEVILGTGYSTSIDMWSFGCILAELAKGGPAFPGESEKHQLALYMEVLGTPPAVVSSKSLKKNLYFDPSGAPRLLHTSKGRAIICNSSSLEAFLPSVPAAFRDLVGRCLDWNPFTRICPEEALRHPWFAFDNEDAGGRSVLLRTQSSAQFSQTRCRKVSLLLT